MTKSVVVTARIPLDLREKIKKLNINKSKVIREALLEAVEKQEKYITIGGLKEPTPTIPKELSGLLPNNIRILYRENKLSPEARKFWDNYEKDLKELLENTLA